MKKIGFLFVLVLFIHCQQPAQEAHNQSQISFEDSLNLRHLKKVLWPKAYREQDTMLLDRILGDDFQMVDASGNWTTKAQEMDWIKENAAENDSFWYEIKRLDIYENGTAIISGTGYIINDSTKTIYQSSNILIKRDGLWKAVTSHVSGIKATEYQE